MFPIPNHLQMTDTHRYLLWRNLEPDVVDGIPRTCMFLMLNPSTATQEQLDPTVRRCYNYAQGWGYRELVVTNLFALRATDLSELRSVEDPIGPHNDEAILTAARYVRRTGGTLVCAWGTDGAYRYREGQVVQDLLDDGHTLHVLTLTKKGHPGHPLYLRKDLIPFPWSVETEHTTDWPGE